MSRETENHLWPVGFFLSSVSTSSSSIIPAVTRSNVFAGQVARLIAHRKKIVHSNKQNEDEEELVPGGK